MVMLTWKVSLGQKPDSGRRRVPLQVLFASPERQRAGASRRAVAPRRSINQYKNIPRYDNDPENSRKRPQIPKEKRDRQDVQKQDALLLPRSMLMDKEIITRTSGKRLGYVDDLYVDPVSLEVTSLYLRKSVSSLSTLRGPDAGRDHVSLSSLRQIGDVVLVHDESSLWDPPADESLGFVRMIGAEVCTEDGLQLGKIRDFLFNPDNGQILSIRYDALGLPSIPQELLGCSRLDERDIVAVGPTKTIVRRGSEMRAIKENEGWVTEYVTSLINVISGMDIEEIGNNSDMPSEKYRADPAYAAWYEKHARDYEMYYNKKLPEPIGNKTGDVPQRRSQPGRQPSRPLALPAPQRRSVGQVLQNNGRARNSEPARRSRMTIDPTRPRQQEIQPERR
jgi:sporulation protein YlmC with PRC-barrel domain